jgi:hypothetical protein
MNVDLELVEKHIKKSTILANIVSITGALIVAMSVGYGFYYKTNSTLADHTKDIIEIKKDVNTFKTVKSEIDVFKGVSKIEVKSLEEKVDKNIEYIEKMNDKLDQILLQTR